MLIDRIKKDPQLSTLIQAECEENGVCIRFDESIDRSKTIILKPDAYYNGLKIGKPPASVDCLIIRECTKVKDTYGLTLVELKDSKEFKIKNIIEKFETILEDFIPHKFKELLDREYESIHLYLVTHKKLHRKNQLGTLPFEVLHNTRLKFRGKRVMINPRMPTPVIKNCY